MNFIISDNQTKKTLFILNLANEYIIKNGITKEDGYILMFTPSINRNSNNKEGYTLEDINKLNNSNFDIIKVYELNIYQKALGLISNFLLISYKYDIKGLKMIIIDEISLILKNWVNDFIKVEKLNKNTEISDINMILAWCNIFQRFLGKINQLIKAYNAPCYITLSLDFQNVLETQCLLSGIFPFLNDYIFLQKDINEKLNVNNLFKIFLEINSIKYSFIEEENEEKKEKDETITKYIAKTKKIYKNKNKKHNKNNKVNFDNDFCKKALNACNHINFDK